MSDPLARSRRITRRTLGVFALAAFGFTLARAWPSLFPPTGLAALRDLPEAAALKMLGARPEAAGLGDVAARLERKLDEGYVAALARDRAAGAILSIDGWALPETQVLAAAWLAANS